MESTTTAWGYMVTASGGTALASLTNIVPKGTRIKISSIVLSQRSTAGLLVTATTADQVVVTDANNVHIVTAAGMASGVAVNFAPLVVTFPQAITVDGINVGAAGATTGHCSIFVAR